MKFLLALCLTFCISTAIAQSKTQILTKEQYTILREMTRRQADTLQLNEHEYLKLLAINRAVMVKQWTQVALVEEKPKYKTVKK